MELPRTAYDDVPVAERGPAVRLLAPARLHLGFLDPAGTLGRRFGSIGLVVNGFETAIELSPSSCVQVSAHDDTDPADVERAAGYLRVLQRQTGREGPMRLRLVRLLPARSSRSRSAARSRTGTV